MFYIGSCYATNMEPEEAPVQTGEKRDDPRIRQSLAAAVLPLHDPDEKTVNSSDAVNLELSETRNKAWLIPSETRAKRSPIKLPKKWWLYAVPGTILLLCGGLHAIVWRNGALSRSTIAGMTLTKQSAATVQWKLSTKASKYKITLIDHNKKSTSYSLGDMGLHINTAKSISDALDAQKKLPYLQKFALWKTYTFPVIFDTDKTQLGLFVQTKATQVVTPATNATLQTATGEPVVSTAKNGEGYTFKDAERRIRASAESLTSETFWLTKMTIPAAVTDSDLAPIVEKVRGFVKTPIALTVEGENFRPSAATIARWIEPITSNAVDAQLEINSGRVESYLDDILSNYVHTPVSQVIMQQDGRNIPLVAGRDGTAVDNKSAVIRTIIQGLQSGKAVTETLQISHKGFDTVTVNTYDKWIHVDLTNKHLYAYEKSQLIRDIPVTAGAPATPTVVGEYAIYSKYASQNMRGQNADGSSYFQPNVRYVSYFYKDYAIHGNYWRPLSYFGNINSSHGCVSAVNSNAEWIYSWAPIGTPVITHY